MAVNWLDPTAVDTFRNKASQQASPSVVNSFISKRMGEAQTTKIAETGIDLGKIETDPVLRKIQLERTQEEGYKLPSEKDPFAAEKKTALTALNILEEQFGRGDAKNIGGAGDLSYGKGGGYMAKGAASVYGALPTTGGASRREDLAIFQASLSNYVDTFSQALGGGVAKEAEAKRLIEKAPNFQSTDKEVKEWFNGWRRLFDAPTLDFEDKKKDEVTLGSVANVGLGFAQPREQEPQIQQVQEPQDPTRFQKFAKGASDIAPLVGGIIGGVGGGMLGGIPGSAIGTGLGVGGGIAIGESIEDIAGIQDENAKQLLKEVAVQPAMAAVTDLIFGKVFQAGSTLVKGLGSKIINAGDDLALRAVRPSPSQQRKFFQKTGIKIKDFIIKNGLFEKGVEQVDNVINPLQTQFDDIAISSGKLINVDDVAVQFDNEITKLLDIPDKTAQSLASNLSDTKELFIKKYGTGKQIGVDIMTELRRTVDKLIPDSKFMQDPIKAGTNKAVRSIYQTAVQDATEGLTSKTGAPLKDLGIDLSKLYEFRKIALAQEGLGQATLPMGIIRSITALGGGGIGLAGGRDVKSTAVGLLVGLGMPSLLNNPAVIAQLSQQLPRIGHVLQAIPDNQKAKVASSIFARLFTNTGAWALGDLFIDEEGSVGLGEKPPQL